MTRVRELMAFAGLLLTAPVACGASGTRAPDAAAVIVVTDGAAEGTDGPDADGATAVTIGVTSDNCPQVVASAAPASAPLGQPIAVTGTATDRDRGDVLTYTWTAATGQFAVPSAAATTYTCAATGDQQLTVAASDGKCSGWATIIVTCLSGP